jgi:NitT/TauT family transport system substrate-binding protein
MTHLRLLAAVIAACVLSTLPARAQTLPILRLVCIPTDSYGEAYYAQDLGIFAKHGVGIDIVVNSGGAIAINALAGNSADIGVANPLSVAQAFSKGVPISVFAGGGMYTSASPATLLLVPKASTLKTAKDLEGKSIGLPGLGDQLQAATILWLQKNGADATKVKFVEVNPGRLILAALTNNHIDAATAPEPTMTESLQAGARVFGDPFAVIAPRFFVGVWIARTDWLKANPDLARRFADSIYEAGRWANSHPTESAAILAKYTKGDPLLYRSMHRATYFDGAVDPKLLQPPLDAALKTGMLPAAVKATDLITKGF